jgi:hypothetical protein
MINYWKVPYENIKRKINSWLSLVVCNNVEPKLLVGCEYTQKSQQWLFYKSTVSLI